MTVLRGACKEYLIYLLQMYKNLYRGFFIICLSWISYNLYNEYLYPFYYNKFIYPKWELNKKAEIISRGLEIEDKFKSAKIVLSQSEISLMQSECSIYLKPGNMFFDDCVNDKKEKIYYQK